MGADSAREKYDQLLPTLCRLETETKYIVDELVARYDIKIHTISSRVKSFESSARKLQQSRSGGGPADAPHLEGLTDLVGLRIVCLFLSDVTRIVDLLKNSFELVSEDDKISPGDPRVFGYMSHHVILKLKPGVAGPRYDNIKTIVFEVQVRTIAMDAWASISHYLAYKTEAAVPRDMQRDFQAVSGLFYVADQHFEMFFRRQQASRTAAIEKIEAATEPGGVEINLDTLGAFLRKNYPTRQAADREDLSELAAELAGGGYRSIEQLQRDLESARRAFEEMEVADPPVDEVTDEPTDYAAVGLVRASLGLVSFPFYLGRKASRAARARAEVVEHVRQKFEKGRAPYADLLPEQTFAPS